MIIARGKCKGKDLVSEVDKLINTGGKMNNCAASASVMEVKRQAYRPDKRHSQHTDKEKRSLTLAQNRTPRLQERGLDKQSHR